MFLGRTLCYQLVSMFVLTHIRNAYLFKLTWKYLRATFILRIKKQDYNTWNYIIFLHMYLMESEEF